ncbi:unnamed protein product [Xylocopa violacea]|uniref:Uncharacterized protein n=1 Tax=Xylocopa violacea TaxID=135666 RepID=A0ABP1NAW1_XYLVO
MMSISLHDARTIPAELCAHPRPVDTAPVVRFLLSSRVRSRYQVSNVNAQDSSYVIEDQRNNLDPSIEQIFRGPSERRDQATNSKRNIDESKTLIQAEDVNKHVRVKRDGAIRTSDSKNLNEATKDDAKRSTVDKDGRASSRIGRSSRDLPKLQDKDYEVPLDQGKSEYADEAEDESSVGSADKESKYKASQFRVGEDSERFIDQEERSSLYDDFEAKDVVKRGISGAEDYEEMDEEVGAGEDTAALEDSSLDEEMDKKKVHGDVRVKREHENSKETDNVEASEKTGSPDASSGLSNDQKTAEVSVKQDAAPDKDSKVAESAGNKAEKDSSDLGDQSKRNAPERNDNDASKVNSERDTDASKQSLTVNDQTEIESSENAKFQNQESQEATGDRKTQEVSLSGNSNAANDLVGDPSSLKGASKTDDSKIAEVPSLETAKVDTPVAEDASKLANSKNEAAVGEQLDANYEKRVEEQIQRKIDSIKEEIKREIAENQRAKEIEENNAKFDELREQEDDDEDQALESEPSEKRESPSKRSVRIPGKSQTRESAEKRSVKRKKRQGETDPRKVQGASESSSSKKSRQATAKKRSATTKSATQKKREYPRQVYLVRNDRKKKRKRRSKNPASIPEQRSTKLEDGLPADFMLDSGLRGDLDGKSSASRMTEDEKALVGQDSFSDKKSGSVASLTGSNEELGPLATEYREAFGGLNGEPGVALARFKRIKRVLRPSTSKSWR